MGFSWQYRYSTSFILFIIFIAFGDGVGFYLRDEFGMASPHLLMMLVLGAALFYVYTVLPSLDLERVLGGILIPLVVIIAWTVLQVGIEGGIYLLGYGQLILFLIFLVLVRKLFEAAPQGITEKLLGAIIVIHYLQCAYIILMGFAWYGLGLNLNFMNLLNPAEISEYYGFRASGISREPAWAAIAIASTYLGVHYFFPSRRTGALIVFVLAVFLINAGTGYIFALVFSVAYLFEQRSAAMWVSVALMALMVLALTTYFQWDRILSVLEGTDPSLNMRWASVGVAVQVIFESFPVGTGYGNFRNFGIYGAEFDNFIDLYTASFYKSDILLLNLVAELGLLGVAIAWWILRIVMVPDFILPTLVIAIVMVMFGTILVPPILLIVAISGLLSSAAGRHQTPRDI